MCLARSCKEAQSPRKKNSGNFQLSNFVPPFRRRVSAVSSCKNIFKKYMFFVHLQLLHILRRRQTMTTQSALRPISDPIKSIRCFHQLWGGDFSHQKRPSISFLISDCRVPFENQWYGSGYHSGSGTEPEEYEMVTSCHDSPMAWLTKKLWKSSVVRRIWMYLRLVWWHFSRNTSYLMLSIPVADIEWHFPDAWLRLLHEKPWRWLMSLMSNPDLTCFPVWTPRKARHK